MLNRRDVTAISVDGKMMPVRYLGNGIFSYAYKGHDGRVYFLSDDPGKKAIAEKLGKSRNPHIPKLKRHADWRGFMVFSSPFYYDVTGQAAEQMREIQSVWGTAPSDRGTRAVKYTLEKAKVPRAVKNAIQTLLKTGYGKLSKAWIDDSDYNFGMDARGRLVLRDIVAP